MTLVDLWPMLEAAAKSGLLGLALTLAALLYQTRRLDRTTASHAACEDDLARVRVGVARLYTIVRQLRGESDPLPPLDELMTDRRGAGD